MKSFFTWITRQEVLFGIAIVILSYFTYVHHYTTPPALYWDENYHIASAQKYLNNVYFMEQHPPLGKLLIALGEKLVDANDVDNQFLGTDYAQTLPAGFSFAGYRLFPVLFAWIAAPMLYLIFLMITRSSLSAFFLSFLYVFDNALIVHGRAAMLDAIMLTLCITMILLHFLILRWQDKKNLFPLSSLLFGVTFGLLLTTKVLGLIMVLLVPVILWELRNHWSKVAQFLALSLAGFLIAYIAVWQVHFSLGKTVVSTLPDNGYYQASQEYKDLIVAGKTNFKVMLRDSLAFVKHYNGGVPQLDLTKPDENGSPFFFWPVGARSISYRWETPDGHSYQYLYLQVNPAVWILSLIGIFLGAALLACSQLVPMKEPLPYRKELLIWFSFYASYMIAVSQIHRVMYLYHYFLPLSFSFILFAYVFMSLKQLGVLKLTEERKRWLLLGMGAFIFFGFQFYRPLSYYEPLTDAQFERRAIFPLWELHCVNCPRDSLLVSVGGRTQQ